MIQLSRTLVYLAVFGDVINNFLVEDIHPSHLLVDLWQKLHILCCILDHCLRKWPLLPEFCVTLHLRIDFIFLGVDLTQILFEQIIQTNINVSIVIVLQKI